MTLLSFALAILPVILIGLYIYIIDNDKESSKLLFKLFMLGILSCFPSVIIGLFLDMFFPEMENMSIFQLFIYVFVVIALVEEFCKWFLLYKSSYNHSEFDTLYDMVVYSVFVALGFACFENILYVASSNFLTAIVRAFFAVPGHACDGIIMGVYLGFSKISFINGDTKNSNKYKILSIAIPTITHGIYDFCLFVGNYVFAVIFIIFVIALDVYCIKKVKNISKNDVRFIYKNNYCPKCGNKNI